MFCFKCITCFWWIHSKCTLLLLNISQQLFLEKSITICSCFNRWYLYRRWTENSKRLKCKHFLICDVSRTELFPPILCFSFWRKLILAILVKLCFWEVIWLTIFFIFWPCERFVIFVIWSIIFAYSLNVSKTTFSDIFVPLASLNCITMLGCLFSLFWKNCFFVDPFPPFFEKGVFLVSWITVFFENWIWNNLYL